jgi:hypothetical protein
LNEEFLSAKYGSVYSDLNFVQLLLNQKQRESKFKYKIGSTTSPFLANYTDDFFYDSSNVNLKELDFYSNNTNMDSVEDSYEALKGVYSLVNSSYKNLVLVNTNFTLPVSYANVFNSFRADFSEAN